MSFLRGRLSRVFGNFDDGGDKPRNGGGKLRKSSLTDTSFYKAIFNISNGDCNSSVSGTTAVDDGGENMLVQGAAGTVSPGIAYLHKAASSTIKLFSDTIRSKTQLFYTVPVQPTTPHLPYTGPSSRQGSRSSILLSLRSRASRQPKVCYGDLGSQGSPVRTGQVDLPHLLNVDIPDSSLLGTLRRTASQHGTEFQENLAQIPTLDACQLEPIHAEASFKSLHNSEVSDNSSDSPVARTSQDQTTALGEKECSVGSAESSYFLPPSRASAKSHVSGNLFTKGSPLYARNFKVPSPYRQAVLGMGTDSTRNTLSEVSKLREDDQLPSRPSVYRAPSLLQELNVLFSGAPINRDGRVASRTGYEADSESSSELSEEPSMGSRAEWVELRANRERRYGMISGMSAIETESDSSEESGLELCHCNGDMSPQDKPLQFTTDKAAGGVVIPESESLSNHAAVASKVVQDFSLSNVSELRSPSIPRRLSVNTGRLGYAVEAIERANGEELVSPIEAPQGPLRFAVEENNRIDGLDLEKNDNIEQRSFVDSVDDSMKEAIFEDNCRAEEFGTFSNLNSLAQEFTKLGKVDSRSSSYLSLLPASTYVDNCLEKHSGDTLTAEEVHHIRKSSGHSNATSASCAITTHSPGCYYPSSYIKTVHIRTTPVRTTSSINIDVLDSSKPDSPETSGNDAGPRQLSGELNLDSDSEDLEDGNKNDDKTWGDFLDSLVLKDRKRELSMSATLSDPSTESLCTWFAAHPDVPNDPALLPPQNATNEAVQGSSPNIFPPAIFLQPSTPMPGSFICSPERPKREETMDLDSMELVDESLKANGEPADIRTPSPTPLEKNYRNVSSHFNAAKLPIFGSPTTPGSSPNDRKMAAAYQTLVAGAGGAALRRMAQGDDSSPRASNKSQSPTSGSGTKHVRNRSWQMRGTDCSEVDFRYYAVDSSKRDKDLRSSSVRKGVWWGRAQELMEETCSPLASSFPPSDLQKSPLGRRAFGNSIKNESSPTPAISSEPFDRDIEALLHVESVSDEEDKKKAEFRILEDDNKPSVSDEETEEKSEIRNASSVAGIAASFFDSLAPYFVRIETEGEKEEESKGLESRQGQQVVSSDDDCSFHDASSTRTLIRSRSKRTRQDWGSSVENSIVSVYRDD